MHRNGTGTITINIYEKEEYRRKLADEAANRKKGDGPFGTVSKSIPDDGKVHKVSESISR